MLTGKRISLTCDEATRLFLHPWVLTVYSGISLISVALDEQPWIQGMPVWERTAIYFLSSVVGLFGAWSALMLLAQASLKNIIENVYSIIPDCFGAFMSIFTTYCLVVMIGRTPVLSSLPSILLYIFYVVIIVHVSLLLWSLLAPRLLLEMRNYGEAQDVINIHPRNYTVDSPVPSLPEEEDTPQPYFSQSSFFVVVSGQRILASDISYMSAQGNYVQIFTDARNYFVAGSLQEVIGQLPDDIGLRVHRSHWISYKAIKEIIPNGRGLVVMLNSGIEVPVSRNNQNSVKQLKLPLA